MQQSYATAWEYPRSRTGVLVLGMHGHENTGELDKDCPLCVLSSNRDISNRAFRIP